jgi:hypothetical protein
MFSGGIEIDEGSGLRHWARSKKVRHMGTTIAQIFCLFMEYIMRFESVFIVFTPKLHEIITYA